MPMLCCAGAACGVGAVCCGACVACASHLASGGGGDRGCEAGDAQHDGDRTNELTLGNVMGLSESGGKSWPKRISIAAPQERRSRNKKTPPPRGEAALVRS